MVLLAGRIGGYDFGYGAFGVIDGIGAGDGALGWGTFFCYVCGDGPGHDVGNVRRLSPVAGFGPQFFL